MHFMKPLSIRGYAGAIEQLAKTDRMDAFVIAEFGAVIQPRPTPQKSKNRIKIMGKAFETSCRRIIKTFDAEITRQEKQLDKLVSEQDRWSQKKEIMLSVPGVGNTLAYTLLADLPEIGTMSKLL